MGAKGSGSSAAVGDAARPIARPVTRTTSAMARPQLSATSVPICDTSPSRWLLGQDELVGLGDVEPVLLAPVDDHDPAPAPEELGAHDARGGAGGHLAGGGRLAGVVDHASSSLICWAR